MSPSSLAKVLLALAWLLSPAMAFLWTQDDWGWAFASGLVALSIGALAIPALWSRSLRGHLLSLAPVALLSGFATAYILTYRTPLTAGLVLSLLATHEHVFIEQAARYATVASACLAGGAVYLWCAWTLPRERATPARPAWAALGLWSLVTAIYYPYLEFELYHRLDVPADLSFVRKSYPLNLGFIAADLRSLEALEMIDDEGTTAEVTPTVPEASRLAGSRRQVFVLVIGEAVQARAWTTFEDPMVLPGALYFGDTLAQANLSRTSVTMLVTGARTLSEARSLPSLIDWQRAAGCQTAFISNASSFRFALRADMRHNTHKEERDHDLLPIIRSVVANPALTKLCLTVQTLGSHQDYRHRYSSRFAERDVTGYPEVTALRNAYHNTLVSTRDFLRSIAQILEEGGGEIFMAYAADHGENLLEINGLPEHGSLTPTEFELHVPMLYWANDDFITAHPQAWRQLGENRHAPVSNANLVPTLLDAMGQFDVARRHHPYSASLLRPFQPAPRHFVAPDLLEHDEHEMLRERRP